ncbi:MAG: 30S ribosomal protein S2 [Marine Group II euryarchaeote MED-G33]|nr:MAG: 30S ribosomal protein S2 [Marine Group II euryarchaeote MED-G33]
MTESMLLPQETYLVHKVNIGALQKSADMKPFLSDDSDGTGLHLIDLEQTDARMRIVSQFLNRFDPSRILVVSARQYGQRPARKFAQAIGAMHIVGRFIPGTLTNPRLRTYIEPELIVVTDPQADQQSLSEAVSTGLPVVAVCDANNNLRNVDLCLPANNKGKQSLALIYWLLSREVLKVRGTMDDETWETMQDVTEWESTF